MSEKKPIKVLLVDDDSSIRTVLAKLLERHHISVVVLATVEEAIDTLESDPEINQLLVDFNLSQKRSGREVALAALKIRPELSCIFMSGDHTLTLAEIDIEGSDLILKPFLTDELIERFKKFHSGSKSPQAASRKKSKKMPDRQGRLDL